MLLSPLVWAWGGRGRPPALWLAGRTPPYCAAVGAMPIPTALLDFIQQHYMCTYPPYRPLVAAIPAASGRRGRKRHPRVAPSPAL